jgi:hypothetical protein
MCGGGPPDVPAAAAPGRAPAPQSVAVAAPPNESGGAPQPAPRAKALPQPRGGFTLEHPLYASDEFRIYSFKIAPCRKRYTHDCEPQGMTAGALTARTEGTARRPPAGPARGALLRRARARPPAPARGSAHRGRGHAAAPARLADMPPCHLPPQGRSAPLPTAASAPSAAPSGRRRPTARRPRRCPTAAPCAPTCGAPAACARRATRARTRTTPSSAG